MYTTLARWDSNELSRSRRSTRQTHTRSLCGACLNSVDILLVVVAIKPLLIMLFVRVRVSAVALMLAVRGMLRKRGLVNVCTADM